MHRRSWGIVAVAVLLLAGGAGAREEPSGSPAPPAKKRAAAKSPKSKTTSGLEDLLEPLARERTYRLRVHLASPVPGAKVWLDDAPAGDLPLSTALTVRSGEHRVRVRRPGYRDFEQTVKPPSSGGPVELEVELQAVAGILSVKVDAPGAEVWVDDAPVGSAPLEQMLLPPGEHEVEIRSPGYVPQKNRLAVVAGQDYEWSVKLQRANLAPGAPRPEVPRSSERPEDGKAAPPSGSGSDSATPAPTEAAPSLLPSAGAAAAQLEAPPPWYAHWYIWAGVAAVTTVGAVLVLQKNRQLPPCQGVCGPPAAASAGLRF